MRSTTTTTGPPLYGRFDVIGEGDVLGGCRVSSFVVFLIEGNAAGSCARRVLTRLADGSRHHLGVVLRPSVLVCP